MNKAIFLSLVQSYVGDPQALLRVGVGPAFRALPLTQKGPEWAGGPGEE